MGVGKREDCRREVMNKGGKEDASEIFLSLKKEATTMTTKLEALKKAMKGFKDAAKRCATEFMENHKESEDVDMEALTFSAGLTWLLETVEPTVQEDKRQSKAQDIIGDKEFIRSAIAKFGKVERQTFKNFLDIVEYIEGMNDEDMEEKLDEFADILREHESFIPVKDGEMVLPPEEVSKRVKALGRIEEHYRTFSQFCADEFVEAPDKMKCLCCRETKRFHAKATFAYCLQLALLGIYHPIKSKGEYYCLWLDEKR